MDEMKVRITVDVTVALAQRMKKETKIRGISRNHLIKDALVAYLGESDAEAIRGRIAPTRGRHHQDR